MDEHPRWQPTITRGLELLTIGEVLAVLVLVFVPTTLTVPVVGWPVVSTVGVFALAFEGPSGVFGLLEWVVATPTDRPVARRRIIHSIIMIPTVFGIHFLFH